MGPLWIDRNLQTHNIYWAFRAQHCQLKQYRSTRISKNPPRIWPERRRSEVLSHTDPSAPPSSLETCRRSDGCLRPPGEDLCTRGLSGRCGQTGACCTVDHQVKRKPLLHFQNKCMKCCHSWNILCLFSSATVLLLLAKTIENQFL